MFQNIELVIVWIKFLGHENIFKVVLSELILLNEEIYYEFLVVLD